MEIYRTIRGYENYQVSNVGNVKNKITGKILKPWDDGRGYLKIELNKKTHRVHRLVAIEFIPNPRGLDQVNHIDGDKKNNLVTNLEWCTNAENTQHAYDNGLKQTIRILSSDDERYILEHYKKGSRTWGANALARKFGVSQPTITYCLKRNGLIE